MTNNKTITLAGIKLPYKTTNENNQASTDCGQLWQKFVSDNIADKVAHKLFDHIYAVYYDYDKDETQPYSYFIGYPVAGDAEVDTELTSITIPPQQYQKFTAKGAMPDCIANMWRKIWSTKLDRRYGFDFEIYDHRSQDWSNAEVDIFLSVNS